MSHSVPIKTRRDGWLRGVPAVGQFPAVPDQPVRLLGWTDVAGTRFVRVRLRRHGRAATVLCVHPNRLMTDEVTR